MGINRLICLLRVQSQPVRRTRLDLLHPANSSSSYYLYTRSRFQFDEIFKTAQYFLPEKKSETKMLWVSFPPTETRPCFDSARTGEFLTSYLLRYAEIWADLFPQVVRMKGQISYFYLGTQPTSNMICFTWVHTEFRSLSQENREIRIFYT